MLHFNIQKGRVVVDPLNLSLKFVKEIYAKFPDPDRAIRVLTYVHVVSRLDPTAPFFSADVKEIEDLAKIQYFVEGEMIDAAQLKEWRKAYEKAYETPEVRVVKIFNDKIDQIRDLIKDTTPEIRSYTTSSGSEGVVSNVPIITKAMNDLDNLLDAKEKLEARVRKQSAKKGKIQGGKTASRLEQKHMKDNPR